MKRFTTLFAAAVAGLFLSLSPVGEQVAEAMGPPGPQPGITICVLRICPQNDQIAVGSCKTGVNSNHARALAIAEINQICASL